MFDTERRSESVDIPPSDLEKYIGENQLQVVIVGDEVSAIWVDKVAAKMRYPIKLVSLNARSMSSLDVLRRRGMSSKKSRVIGAKYWAGIDCNYRSMGSIAVDLVAGDLAQSDRKLVRNTKSIEVVGDWVNGSSLD